MKRKITAIGIAILLFLSSCDLFMPQQEKGRIYFIAVGLGYRNSVYNALYNTINDYNGMLEQMECLFKQGGYEYYISCYDDFETAGQERLYRFSAWSSARPEAACSYFPGTLESEKEKQEYFLDTIYENAISDTDPSYDDTLIFYYTGHGRGIGDKKAEGPVILDSPTEDFPLPYSIINKKLSSRFPGRTLYIYDCCYSGLSTEDGELGKTESYKWHEDAYGNKDYHLQPPSVPEIIANAWKATFSASENKKDYVISSSHKYQLSMEYDDRPSGPNQERYGAFTYQVLRYLGYDMQKEKAMPVEQGSSFSVAGLYRYVYDNMSSSNRKHQTPNILTSRLDFEFLDI